MTRYYVDISCDLLRGAYKLEFPDSFRLVSRFGPRTEFMERWIVEDDEAPEEIEDFLVTPSFKKEEDGTVTIIDRDISSSRY